MCGLRCPIPTVERLRRSILLFRRNTTPTDVLLVIIVAVVPFATSISLALALPFSLFRGCFSIGTQDYPLADDIAAGDDTPIIYSWRSGEGIGKHPNSQRGNALVNFADATATSSSCDDSTDYYALHGALLLFVWMLIAPYGIYQAR